MALPATKQAIKRIVWENGDKTCTEEFVGKSLYPSFPKVKSIVQIKPHGSSTPEHYKIFYENGDTRKVYNIVEVYSVPV